MVVEPGAVAPRRQREQVVGEEPLEIRVIAPDGEQVATTATMRTPGGDFALAAGLMHAEGVIAGAGDVHAIRYCEEPAQQQYNAVRVELANPPRRQLDSRTLLATASCGICGSAQIDELCARVLPVASGLTVDPALLIELPDRMREAQRLFDQTGGLHAAALFDGAGQLVALHEDIGRHNALDKLIGDRLLAGQLPLADGIVVLSGRISFELVQKAAAAGTPVLAAVSAPSTLAVETADRLGVTLAGFVRDGRATLYAHPGRIAQS